MYPVALNYNIRSKQITIEHKFKKCSYCYMFHPHRAVIIRLAFRTYQKKYTYRFVEVRFQFLQIYLQLSFIYMKSY